MLVCGNVTRQLSPTDGWVDGNWFRCHRILFARVFVIYVPYTVLCVQLSVRSALRQCLPQNLALLRFGCYIVQFYFCSSFHVSLRLCSLYILSFLDLRLCQYNG